MLAANVSFLSVWNFIWPILVAILLFGLIIFVHELGHFIFAKAFGVKVNEFALGFGPTIFKYTKGETKYALRIFPLGGFCAMEGEDTDSEDDNSINKKPVWQRIIIIAAGAIFNIILGFILIMSMILVQPNSIGTPKISTFEKGALSSSALQVGDKITKINGRAIYTTDDVLYMLLLNSNSNGTVNMTVIRNGHKLNLKNIKFPLSEKINGRRYVLRDFTLMPIPKTFGNVVNQSFLKTISMSRMVWMSLGDMVSGKFTLNDMSGPVGITKEVASTVSQVPQKGGGIVPLIYIMSLITVNLGLMNLLPIPALDGGRLVFLVIEGIRRKPVDPKTEGLVHAIGFALLILLIIIITGNDILKLFTGGYK